MRRHPSRKRQSSHDSSPRVAIDLRLSWSLIILWLVALASAAIACASVALSGAPLRGLLATAALALSVRDSLRLIGLGPDSIRRFIWTECDDWLVQNARGRWQAATLLPATTVIGPFMLLIWRNAAGRRSHALIHASRVADERAFRVLRGRLRLEKRRLPRPGNQDC
jgi:hypothetical protein